MSETKLLDGLKVVDLGVGLAPTLAAKFLADLGCQVTRVPPAGGDPFATYYPAYTVLQRGSQVDAAAAASPERLEQLLAQADVCLVGGEDHPDLVRRSDAAAIAQRHPRLVVLDITDGPAGTRYAGRPCTELLAQVRSGLAQEQEPDRPIVNAFGPATYGAAFHGLIGVLAALFERESASGLGQLVTTSLFEGSLLWVGGYWGKLEKGTPMANFVIPKGVTQLILQAKDGVYVQIVQGSKGAKYGLYKVLGIDDPSVQPHDSGMPKPGGSPRNFFGDYDLMAAHAAKKTSQEIMEGMWALGLAAEPVLPPGACWNEPQILRNQVIAQDADGTRHVGLPFLYQTTAPGTPMKRPPTARPLEGIRILDSGAFWAGPFGSTLLTDLGAEVIKVEPLEGDPNRAIFKAFTFVNRGKQGLMVDLKSAEGSRLLKQLCGKADVVMSNFRPGVAARLGLDAATLHAQRPEMVVLESPAYGSEGPLAAKAGFDMVMQAWCGHDAHAAGRDNPPRWNRVNVVDQVAGYLGAAALLAALVQRARTGSGTALELPLVNAGLYLLSELFQGPDGQFRGLPTLNHSVSGFHPAEALYQAQDAWVALVARGAKAALQLRQALGLNAVLSDAVATWGEAEEAAIARAVAQHTAAELQALLEPLGVWVEVARNDMEDAILGDPDLLQRGTVHAVTHPSFGEIRELACMFKLSRSATGNSRAAPLPGGDTRAILAAEGYDAATVQDYLDRGVVKVP